MLTCPQDKGGVFNTSLPNDQKKGHRTTFTLPNETGITFNDGLLPKTVVEKCSVQKLVSCKLNILRF